MPPIVKSSSNALEPDERNNNNNEPDLSEVNRDADFDSINNEAVIKTAAREFTVAGDPGKLNIPVPEANHASVKINIDAPVNPDNAPQSSQSSAAASKPGAQQSANPGQAQPGQQSTSNTKEKQEPFNPEFAELPKKEQEESLNLMVYTLVNLYAQGKLKAGAWAGCVSERKLEKLHFSGEINKYQLVHLNPDAPHEKISIEQFIQKWNEKSIAPFQTSQEFVDSVIPLLTAILKRKGAVATPEQQLLGLVIIDLLGFLMAVKNSISDKKDMLNMLRNLNPVQKNNTENKNAVEPDVKNNAPSQSDKNNTSNSAVTTS